MKSVIQSVEISYLLHETEDQARVESAVSELTPTPPETEELEGHFGNRILRVKVHVTGEDAERLVRGLVGRMPKALREEVLLGLDASIDEHSTLFIRFDKQKLVLGALAIGATDPVRVKVKPRGYMLKDGAQRFYAQLLGGK